MAIYDLRSWPLMWHTYEAPYFRSAGVLVQSRSAPSSTIGVISIDRFPKYSAPIPCGGLVLLFDLWSVESSFTGLNSLFWMHYRFLRVT